MNKIKFLYLIIVILIGTNIGLVLFMYTHKPPHPMNAGGPKKVISEKLHFTANQEKEYEAIIKEHQTTVQKIESKIRSSKNSLFELLKTNDSSKKDSIIQQLGVLQTEIESAHFNHFKSLKGICKPDQMAAFNQLTEELNKLFAPPIPPKKR